MRVCSGYAHTRQEGEWTGIYPPRVQSSHTTPGEGDCGLFFQFGNGRSVRELGSEQGRVWRKKDRFRLCGCANTFIRAVSTAFSTGYLFGSRLG